MPEGRRGPLPSSTRSNSGRWFRGTGALCPCPIGVHKLTNILGYSKNILPPPNIDPPERRENPVHFQADAWFGRLAWKMLFLPGNSAFRRMQMNTVTVYRIDYVRKSKVPIGKVEERRRMERGDNLLGLLRLARKSFASSPQDALHIAVDRKEALQDRVRV